MASIKAIFFDLGDTIMQEVTEVKDDTLTTQTADLFPGMAALLHTLKERGYKLGLVADTRPGTYRNVLNQHQLFDLFDVFAISEELGVVKPHPLMFQHALVGVGLSAGEASAALMVGNNLSRDVRGARDLGIGTVWIHWNDRYPTIPACGDEEPLHIVQSADELIALINHLEAR
jgi:FMN phosphatase YigB (HAD superfamily)